MGKNNSYSQWADVKYTNNIIENTDTNAGGFSIWAPAANPAAPKTEVKPLEGYSELAEVPRYKSGSGAKTEVEPITDTGTPTTGAPTASDTEGHGVWADAKLPEKETDHSFSQWLAADPAYQAALKQAQADYDRSRATYGAQGEALARSGLIGSGYSEWADAQAYAQMQSAKENARNTSYAVWLGEKEQEKKEAKAAQEKLKGDQATIVQYILGQNRAEITDGDMALLKGLGYSDEAIAGAKESLLGYKDTFDQRKAEEEKTAKEETVKTQTAAILTWATDPLEGPGEITSANIPLLKGMGYSDEAIAAAQNALAESKQAEKDQAATTFKDSLTKFNTDGDATAFLEANGVKVEGDIAQNTNALVDAKLADGTIDKATASAYYRDTVILDEDLTGKSIAEVAKAAREAAQVKSSVREKLTDADYKAILQASYDALGVTDVIFENSNKAKADVTIKVNVNGVQRTYTCDWGGEFRVGSEKNAALNQEYGNAKLALYNGNMYYQYTDDKWTEIKIKGGSDGENPEGNNVLAVVAAYYGANQINRSVLSEEGKQEIRDEIQKSINYASSQSTGGYRKPTDSASAKTVQQLIQEAEGTKSAYLNGNMTKTEAIEWLMTNQSLTERNATMMVDLWAANG